MKHIFPALLALALVIALAACGATPETETAIADEITGSQPYLADEPPGATRQRITLPELQDSNTAAIEAGAYSAIMTQLPVTATAATTRHATSLASITAPAATRPVVSSPPSTARTTTTRAATIPTTRPTTAATTAQATTSTTTTTTTSTTTAQGPVTIHVSRDALMAQFASQQVVQQVHMTDSIGRESTRTYTGAALTTILAHNGVNLNAVPANARLRVTAADGYSLYLSRAEFMSATTLLAWHEDRHNGNGNILLDRPRLVFPSGLSGRFVQNVATLSLIV